MSRTWHHRLDRLNWLEAERHTIRYRGTYRVLRYDRWYANEPRWWRKLYKHRKRRAEWLRCSHKLRKGYDPDDMVYPMDSKPWEYYW